MVKERKLSDQPVSNSKDESGPELLIKELEQGVNQLVKLVASGSKERHGSYMRKASHSPIGARTKSNFMGTCTSE